MKRNVKLVVLYLLGAAACKIAIAGCYPLVPAYFTVMCLQGLNRRLLSVLALLEIVWLLPVVDSVKYGVVLLCILAGIQLCEWVNKKCRDWYGASMAGAVTVIISVAGGMLMDWSKEDYLLAGLEGVFIACIVTIGNHLVNLLLTEPKIQESEEKSQSGRGEKLYEYAQSFQNLAKIFATRNERMEVTLKDTDKMQEEITGKICANCGQCAICWEEKQQDYMGQIFHSLMKSIWSAGTPERGLKLQLREYCPNSVDIIEEMVSIFEKTNLNVAWYNRLVENREAIAQQLDAMAYIMEDCAECDRDIGKKERLKLGKMKYRLRENGIALKEMSLCEKQNGKWQLKLLVYTKRGNFVPVRDVAKLISKELKHKMVPHRDTKTLLGKGETELVLEEDARYQEIHGIAKLTKEGANISGDNFSVLPLDNGEMVYSISDGMGSGANACKESEMVVELIEKFLEAGFSKETALRMMNSAMVIHGNNNCFSTVDMTSVNLYDGTCEIYKIGAAATFLRRNGVYEYLTSNTLPTGVEYSIDLKSEKYRLKDGDFIIMMTDGVLEYLHVPEPEETMLGILQNIHSENPAQIARSVMEHALLYTGGAVRDDMTVLCAGIWEKETE